MERAGEEENKSCSGSSGVSGIEGSVVKSDAKRVLIGAGARALFYPTLLYNVVRNKNQPEFRWWDRVDEFILLGALPFPTDVPKLKEIGVQGVITLNEPYETSGSNITLSKTTAVHHRCHQYAKLLISFMMTPVAAYDYVRSIRPRVRLASSQWQTVQEFYYLEARKVGLYSCMADLTLITSDLAPSRDLAAFDDGSVVVVTEGDLDGYDQSLESGYVRSTVKADLSVVYRVRVDGQAAVARISCLWLRCQTHQNISAQKLGKESSYVGGAISVDIYVY